MSINRWDKAVDANQREIIDGLEAAGCSVCVIARPVDLLVGYAGVNHLLEIKLPLGPKGGDPSRRTLSQRDFYERWKGTVREIRSLDEALAAIQSHPSNTASVVQRLTKLRARLERIKGDV